MNECWKLESFISGHLNVAKAPTRNSALRSEYEGSDQRLYRMHSTMGHLTRIGDWSRPLLHYLEPLLSTCNTSHSTRAVTPFMCSHGYNKPLLK
jgi:hypothetical protein